MRRSTPMPSNTSSVLGLHANGFRMLRRFDERVDDAACDAAPGELDGGRHADRVYTGDQHLRL
jgi:hypothetical protein